MLKFGKRFDGRLLQILLARHVERTLSSYNFLAPVLLSFAEAIVYAHWLSQVLC